MVSFIEVPFALEYKRVFGSEVLLPSHGGEWRFVGVVVGLPWHSRGVEIRAEFG